MTSRKEDRGKAVCHSCESRNPEKKLKTQPRLAELGGVTDEK